MNNALTVAMESIDFQRNSSLLADMSKQFASVMKDPSKDTMQKVSKSLAKIAFDATGIQFNFHFARLGQPNAFVIVPDANTAHPMSSNNIVKRVRSTRYSPSEKELFQGTVDLSTGKVSGIYSQIPIDIFMALEFFTAPAMAGVMEAEFIAAIAMHEMGHGFGYLRYLGKLTIANCVVAEIIKQQHEGASDKIIQDVVKVSEQKTGWRLRDLGEITQSTNPLVIQQIVMASAVESIRSELNTKFYDRRAFEFTADQFVARHGGAAALVQSLDAMYTVYARYIRDYNTDRSNIQASLISYAQWSLGLILVIPTLGTPIGYAVMFGLFILVMKLFGEGDDGTYDAIRKRYEAMRRELIASSKGAFLTVNQRKDILNQIDLIDKCVGNVASDGSYFGPEAVKAWIVDTFDGRRGEKKFQQHIENMVNNRLFEMSNKIQATHKV